LNAPRKKEGPERSDAAAEPALFINRGAAELKRAGCGADGDSNAAGWVRPADSGVLRP